VIVTNEVGCVLSERERNIVSYESSLAIFVDYRRARDFYELTQLFRAFNDKLQVYVVVNRFNFGGKCLHLSGYFSCVISENKNERV